EALFRGLYRKGAFDMEQFANLPKEQRVLQMEPLVFAENPPGEFILSEDELQFFLNAFQRNGVTPGINWYRNISANWRATEKADPKIHVPCLMIEVSDDPSGPPGCAEEMKPYIDDLEVARIEDCGHWTQHEKPDELADLMIDWLTRRFKN
ncbi:MAG: alpha/beta hydrolase, partial [Alphaproteobacteria bacterium]|nr:alpha/beta hydrolase [Alphaproteobacteria bacterium]